MISDTGVYSTCTLGEQIWVTQPTCVSSGRKIVRYTCRVCGDSYTEEQDAPPGEDYCGRNGTTKADQVSPATCTGFVTTSIAGELFRNREIIGNIISRYTGKTLEEVYEKTAADTYFTAEECIEWGLANSIVTRI